MSATELSTADVLRKAKQVLIERGWTRGRVVDDHGRVCAEGSLLSVGADNMPGDPAYDALKSVVGTVVCRWNDQPERTRDEVLAAFDRAIALAESEASR